jgi:hypothetical protein
MGSLTVHVLDDDENPVSGEKVFCNFSGFTHSEEYTDDQGIAEFDDVPVCDVAVYVSGKKIEVSVGQNDHEDVTFTI